MRILMLRAGLALAAGSAAMLCLAQEGIQVVLNGQPVQFNDTSPREINGRVLVPMRAIFEQLGAYVHWNDATQTVDATKGDLSVRLAINDPVANLNGRNVHLDVPPMIIGGSTMVPLRFVSESLGADVNWNDQSQTVMITTSPPSQRYYPDRRRRDRRGGGGGGNPPNYQPPPPPQNYEQSQRRQESHALHAALRANAIIPVTLDQELQSNANQTGDQFTATINTNGAPTYGALPMGTQVLGHVVTARPRYGDRPGVLQVAFDSIRFPDGTTRPISGMVTSLDSDKVIRQPDGTLIARQRPGTKPGDVTAYIGYGAGAGALLGLLSHGAVVEDAALGGALGYLLHQVQPAMRNPRDVDLHQGTQMGVLLTRPFSY